VRPGAARTRDGRLMLGVLPRSTERCDGAGILDCAMLIGIPGERGAPERRINGALRWSRDPRLRDADRHSGRARRPSYG